MFGNPLSQLFRNRSLAGGLESLESRRMLDGSLPMAIEVNTQQLRDYPEPIAFSWPEQLGAPDPSNSSHFQGLSRYPGIGEATFYVTQNQNDGGSLSVVSLASRADDGERLGSNVQAVGTDSEHTEPPTVDRWLTTIHFDGTITVDGMALRGYRHPGGMAIIDNVLFVGMDDPLDRGPGHVGGVGGIMLFDLGGDGQNRQEPQPMQWLPLDHAIDHLAALRRDDGSVLVWTNGAGGSETHFYTTSTNDLHSDTLRLNLAYDWDPQQFGDLLDASGNYAWPRGTGAHQSGTFVQQPTSHGVETFLLSTRNTAGTPFGGRDFVDTFQVVELANRTRGGTRFQLEYLRSDQFQCNVPHAGRLCNFAAATTAHVSPSGELLVYGVPHDDVDNTDPDLVRLAEFRHETLYHPDNPRYAVQVNAGRGYGVEIGGSVQLSAMASPLGVPPWIELFEDRNFEGRSLLIEYPNRQQYEMDDLSNLDGFNDRADSLRYFLPTGLNLDAYDNANFEGERGTAIGDGTVFPSNTLGDSDKISSIQFVGVDSATEPLTYRWDLDGDGVFGEAELEGANGAETGPDVTFDSTSMTASDPAWPVHVEVCDPAGRCATDTTTIRISRVPASVVLESNATFQDPARPSEAIELLANYSASIEDCPVLEIDWGDGSALEVAATLKREVDTIRATHRYSSPGVYLVRATLRSSVADSLGAFPIRATSQVPVVVRPEVAAGSLQSSVTPIFNTSGFPSLTGLGAAVLRDDGSFFTSGGTSIFLEGQQLGPIAAIRKHLPDGSLDTNFGDQGQTQLPLGGFAHALVELPNSELIAIAQTIVFEDGRHTGNQVVAFKLSAMGQIITQQTLDFGGNFPEATHAILGDDGNLIVAATQKQTLETNAAITLLTLDTNFNEIDTRSIATEFPFAFVTDLEATDTHFAALGYGAQMQDPAADELYLAQFAKADQGDTITTFGGENSQLGDSGGMIIQDDGKIVVVARDTFFDSALLVTRFLPDGTLDPSFGNGGRIYHHAPSGRAFEPGDVVQRADGSFLVTGGVQTDDFFTLDFSLTLLNSDGTLNTSFGDQGWSIQTSLDLSKQSYLLSNDRLLITHGNFDTGRVELAWLTLGDGMISGRTWDDLDNDDQYSDGEAIQGTIVYVDQNHNGHYDLGEPFSTSGPDGTYEITGLPNGEYAVRSENAIRIGGTHPSFGFAIDLSRDSLAVGAPQDLREGRPLGRAYAYDLATRRRTFLEPSITHDDLLNSQDIYGGAVSIELTIAGEVVHVGAPGMGFSDAQRRGLVFAHDLSDNSVTALGPAEQFGPGPYNYGWNFTSTGTAIAANLVGMGTRLDKPAELNRCEFVSGDENSDLLVAGCLPLRVGGRGGVLWQHKFGDDSIGILAPPRADSAFGDTVRLVDDFLLVSDPSYENGPGAQGMVEIYRTDQLDSSFVGDRDVVRISNPGIRGQFGISLDFDDEHLYIGNGFDAVAVYHWDRFNTGVISLREVIARPPAIGHEQRTRRFGFSVATTPTGDLIAVSSVGGVDLGEVFLIPKAEYVQVAGTHVRGIDFVERHGELGRLSTETLESENGQTISITATNPGVVIEQAESLPGPSILPPGVEMPFGQIGFRLSGVPVGGDAQVVIEVFDPSLTASDFAGYYKQLPNGQWFELPNVLVEERTNSLRVTLTLTDGDTGRGDEDGVANGVIVDPGAIALRTNTTDLNGDGLLQTADIDLVCLAIQEQRTPNTFDFNGDGQLTAEDHAFYVRRILNVPVGDVNFDGTFDAADLARVHERGRYRQSDAAFVGWESGDWNCDGLFDSSDLIEALAAR